MQAVIADIKDVLQRLFGDRVEVCAWQCRQCDKVVVGTSMTPETSIANVLASDVPAHGAWCMGHGT